MEYIQGSIRRRSCRQDLGLEVRERSIHKYYYYIFIYVYMGQLIPRRIYPVEFATLVSARLVSHEEYGSGLRTF